MSLKERAATSQDGSKTRKSKERDLRYDPLPVDVPRRGKISIAVGETHGTRCEREMEPRPWRGRTGVVEPLQGYVGG
jgi:hypothetical protein